MNPNELLQLVLNCGADKAALIQQSSIALSAEFREACARNQCGLYGRCWMCPPDVGDIEVLMAQIRAFPQGVLYQTIGTLEDSFDFEGMTAAGRHHAQVSQRIRAALPAGLRVLHLTCGGCRVCETCAKITGEPCRFPDRALPSVESYGVDVYNTARATDLKYINGADTVTYFGLLLFEEDSHAQADHPSGKCQPHADL